MFSTLERVLSDDPSEWIQEDVTAYSFLKAAFYNAFKPGVRKLTGPLLALWADRNGYVVSEEALSELAKALDGTGWCKVDALYFVDTLIGIHKVGEPPRYPANKDLQVTVSPLSSDGLVVGAEVEVTRCTTPFVEAVRDRVTPGAMQTTSGGRGDLTAAISKIIRVCGADSISVGPLNANGLQLDRLSIRLTEPQHAGTT